MNDDRRLAKEKLSHVQLGPVITIRFVRTTKMSEIYSPDKIVWSASAAINRT
jgi:hypothetical protein